MLLERVPGADGRVLDPLPQRSRPGGRQLAWQASAAARGRSSAPSTALASAPATRRWKKSSWRSDARRRACRSGPASTPTMLMRASKLVSRVTAFPVQYNKAIVGQNAFAHETGIHQDGMLKNAADLRDHDARERGRDEDLAGHGQAFRPPRLPREAEGARLRAGRQRLRGCVPRFKDAGRPQEARLRRGYRGAGRSGDRRRRTTGSRSWRSR